MSTGFTIGLSGLNSVLKNLDKASEDIQNGVEDAISSNMDLMRNKAIRDVPVDTGALKNSITINPINKFTYELVAQKEYAPFVEFGTKSSVKVPKGLEKYALQFKKGNSKGMGIRPKPFFFPAIFAYRTQLIQDVIKVLRG